MPLPRRSTGREWPNTRRPETHPRSAKPHCSFAPSTTILPGRRRHRCGPQQRQPEFTRTKPVETQLAASPNRAAQLRLSASENKALKNRSAAVLIGGADQGGRRAMKHLLAISTVALLFVGTLIGQQTPNQATPNQETVQQPGQQPNPEPPGTQPAGAPQTQPPSTAQPAQQPTPEPPGTQPAGQPSAQQPAQPPAAQQPSTQQPGTTPAPGAQRPVTAPEQRAAAGAAGAVQHPGFPVGPGMIEGCIIQAGNGYAIRPEEGGPVFVLSGTQDLSRDVGKQAKVYGYPAGGARASAGPAPVQGAQATGAGGTAATAATAAGQVGAGAQQQAGAYSKLSAWWRAARAAAHPEPVRAPGLRHNHLRGRRREQPPANSSPGR